MRFMALSLSAQGIDYLDAQQWQASLDYRYLHSDRLFTGPTELPAYRNAAVADIHSFDLSATYAITRRFSATLTLPFLDAAHTSAYEHDGVHRHTMRAGGLGHTRLVGNAWLFDPAKSPNGNIGLSAGFKAPTGDYRATDYSYQAAGPVLRPVDFSIQPGDGGW